MDNKGSIASKTCAVIVTYHPDSQFPQRARLIAEQVDAVIVVDNGSDSDHDALPRSLSLIPNLTLVRNDENVGVGAGLNQGLYWAIEQGYAWALLFDQDTTPSKSLVDELNQICLELGRMSNATLLGSNWVDITSGRPWLRPSEYPDRLWVDAKTIQTSGTLIPLAVFEALGPFRTDLFIDCVDVEYCLRARSRGYRVATSVHPLLLHTIGEKMRRRFLRRTVWPTNHPPLRRFFVARNTVLVVREYGVYDPKWALTAMLALAKLLVLVLLFEDDKRPKLWAAARGIGAGLRRHTESDSVAS